MRLIFIGLISSLILFSISVSTAEPEKDKPKEKEKPAEKIEEKISVTQHTATIRGEQISYTATAGTIVLDDEEELSAEASVFYIAYTKQTEDGKASDPSRPIAFCFNGGPGSCAVWLHLGGLGPKRVHLTENGMLPPPPFRLKDNAASILDVADLVFIDPVSTGYSRASEFVR